MPSRTASFLIIIGALAIFLIFAEKMSPFVPDDAYISFRYAENLAHGYGLRFNIGEQPVEGYSNFLWIVLCSIITPFGELRSLAPKMGVGFGAMCIVVLGLILHRRPRSWMGIAFPLGLLATSGPFVLYAVSGMETPLFAFLLLCLVLCLDHLITKNTMFSWLALAVVSAALALTRPEGIIAFPIIAGCAALLGRSENKLNIGKPWIRNILVASILFGAIMISYNIWRIQYFGGLLPTSFTSKGIGGHGLANIWHQNIRFMLIAHNYFAPTGYYYLCLSGLAVAGLWTVRTNRPQSSFEQICLVLAAIFGLVYFNFNDWMPGLRYFSVLVVILLVPLAMLTESLAPRVMIILMLPVFLLSLFTMAEVHIDGKSNEYSTSQSAVQLGKWLSTAVPSSSVLAMSDVGATPYYSKLKTFDIDPRSLTDVNIARHGFSAEYFFQKNPDVVVFVSFSFTKPRFYSEYRSLLEDRRFESYRLVGITRYDWHEDRCYWVYVRGNIFPTADKLKEFPYGIGADTEFFAKKP